MNLLERLTASATTYQAPYKHIVFENLLGSDEVRLMQNLAASIPKKYVTSFNPGYGDSFEHEEIYCMNVYRRGESNLLAHFLNQMDNPGVLRWFLNSLDLNVNPDKKYKINFVLHREFAGFIGLDPHTDLFNSHNNKILNFFFYLSSPEDCPPHYGTKLLEGDAESCTTDNSKLINYRANHALAFAISENSWHMVDALKQDCKRRDVLVMRVSI